MSKVNVGKVFNDYIKTANCIHHLLFISFVIVIKHMVSSTPGNHIHPILGSSSSNHYSPQCPSYLYRSCTNCSTCSMYQHSFSRFGLSPENESFVSSEERNTKRGSLCK